MEKGLSEKVKGEMEKKPTIKQRVLELISELQPISCRGLSMNSVYEIHRLTGALNSLLEEGKIKVEHEGQCIITNREVQHYALVVPAYREEARNA